MPISPTFGSLTTSPPASWLRARRLRAERDLATYYEVSYGTVRRAMEVLRERGLIETIHGRGTFVRKDRG